MNEIIEGDCLEELKKIESNSIDCLYTDVPYLYDCGGGGSSEVALRIRKNINTLDEHSIPSGS